MEYSVSELESHVFMAAPLGLAVINSSTGTIIQVNESYCSILGRSREHLIGKTWMQFTHQDDLIRDVYQILLMRQSGQTQTDRCKRYIRLDGTIIYAKLTLTPLQFDRTIPHHMVMVEDITTSIRMKDELKNRKSELRMTREEMLNALVIVAKFRDRETGGHLQRIKHYVEVLLLALENTHPFSRHGIRLLSHAAMLHDIGKIGIPDSILLKKGTLDSTEFSVMKTHTTLGAKAMLESMRHLRGDSSLMYAREIAELHHEKWDGTGYPYGMRGREIPLSARVLAVADVFDALISKRPYKEAFTHSDSVKIIAENSGTHFDPEIVEKFLEHEREFSAISEEIVDE